jgi:hypothetical protein
MMMLMDITKMLAELYAERDRLDEAICTFVRLQTGRASVVEVVRRSGWPNPRLNPMCRRVPHVQDSARKSEVRSSS